MHNGGLVKTTNFEAAKYIGDPINAVRIFNEKEADELIVLDIDATAKGVDPNFKMIADLAVECRMPLCYGGGIKSVAQAKRIIGLGVEKVALSSAAVANPNLIRMTADEIGSQSVVLVLDVKKSRSASVYEVWTHNGRRNTGASASEIAQQAQTLGVGEIVINSIDEDGRMMGYDLELGKMMRKLVTVPLTVLGGAGCLADIAALIQACGVVGAAAGSLFVFKGVYRAVLINYPSPSQKEGVISSAMSSKANSR